MKGEAFEALVGRLEAQNKRNPEGYKRKVVLLAIAANAYLGFALLLLLVLFAVACLSIVALKAVGIKIALVIGVFLWMVLKALWVRQTPPEGLSLTPKQAPELFRMIVGLQQQLKAPRFHEVLLTDEFNAGVVQVPRLGIFGWPRNYLIIGLPLMKALTVEQFKAVLAHEFGHLAKSHGRFSNWVYRQRLRWEQLVETLSANQSSGSFLFSPFLKRFVPYFSAYSFPLARANEYEADAISVRLTSAHAAAEALTSVNVIGSYLDEKYWPLIHRKADDHPAPNFAPYSGMTAGLAGELDAASAEAWLNEAMGRETTLFNTHPCLRDRLAAISAEPRIRFPQPDEAADQLLGRERETIAGYLDQRWQKHIAASWEQRHAEVQEGRKRLAELNARLAAGAELDPDEAYERALLTEAHTDDADDALVQMREVCARAPERARFNINLAVRLLARDDEGGVAVAQRAMTQDHWTTVVACEALRDYYWRRGDKATADAWHARLVERYELQQKAADERNQIDRKSRFEAHGLSADIVAALRQQLQTVHGLRKAWLVRKQLSHLPDSPCYVLAYSCTPWYRLSSEKRKDAIQATLMQQITYPGEALIFCIEGDNASFGSKVKRVKGSRIL